MPGSARRPAVPPTAANRTALAFVRARAGRERARHVDRIARALAGAGVRADPGDLCAAARRRGMVTVNFHPDRLLADGRSVAEALYAEGVYRSQFESRISNGGLTAFPGGARDRWERALFGGAYQAPGVRQDERPKYGGLNLMNYSDGACPRFGSCYLRLTAAALDRSTFSFGDSASDPQDVGVIDGFEPVLAALLERLAASGRALGRRDLDVAAAVERLLDARAPRGRGLFPPAQGRALDEYIEAQIHGAVRLAGDVAALVVDPSFGETPTGALLLATAARYGFAAEWHPGSALTLGDVPREAPGTDPATVPRWAAFCAHGRAARLAARVIADHAADRRHLDAAAIGQAAVAAVRTPEQWQEWGTTRQALQCLKDLWLILVVYGKPRGGATNGRAGERRA